jgi:hypothetical protein
MRLRKLVADLSLDIGGQTCQFFGKRKRFRPD